jgi:hypothetical protein
MNKILIYHLLLFIFYPGAVNADPAVSLTPPVFSHASGFYSHSFNLVLAAETPGATIFYTLDGSEPDPENLEGSTFNYKNHWALNPGDNLGDLLEESYITHAYSGPITIKDRSPEPDRLAGKSSSYHMPPYYVPSTPVFKGTVVRAIAFLEGHGSSPVTSHTYFVSSRSRYTLPVISITTPEYHLFDYFDGIYTPGIDFDNWRTSNPDMVTNHHRPANYGRRGREYEFPAHFNFWEAGSEAPVLSQDIGYRIHGSSGRSFPMKSFRIYARSEYGTPALDHPFFPEQDYDRYKRIILRNSGNDWHATLFRDAVIHKVCRGLNLETQAYKPAVLFLNGEYWGIHNIRERYDKHYIERVYGIEEHRLDLLTGRRSVQEGDNLHYVETITYIEDNGLQNEEHFRYIQTRIDTENFIDYQIAQIFSANTDWPGNNIDFFRKRTDNYEPESPYGHDGRWRWLLYDMDFGFNIWNWSPPDHYTLEFATRAGETEWPNPDWSTFLLRSFLLNEEFRRDFITRYADLLNSFFLPARINSVIDNYKSGISPEVQEHLTRWKTPSSFGTWESNINAMRAFADSRASWQWSHLIDFFELEDKVSVSLNVSDIDHGFIRVNTIDIKPGAAAIEGNPWPWTGWYFSKMPIRIEAVANEGFRFSHWEGTLHHDMAVLVADPAGIKSLTAHFIPEKEVSLLHYWHFNDLPEEGLPDKVVTDYSYGINGHISYPGTGSGYMDRVSDGSGINLQLAQPEGFGLRVRNPSDTRELVLHASSEGFRDLHFQFAVKRTLIGATSQALFVSPDDGTNWIAVNEPYGIEMEWKPVRFDLSAIPGINDNPNLLLKILFFGDNAAASSGNNRFDNITLKGIRLSDPLMYFSKSEGALNELATWGTLYDGSGTPPLSFELPGAVFHIHNRGETGISGNWHISGAGSGIELGDGENPVELTIPPEYSLTGRINVSSGASLILMNKQIPHLNIISPSSTIAFNQDIDVVIPPAIYGNLHLRNGRKNFGGNYIIRGNFIARNTIMDFNDIATLVLEGNTDYLGTVTNVNPENVNIRIKGENDQICFSEGINMLEGYNIYIEKDAGYLSLTSDIFAHNNLRIIMGNSAGFSDGGHILHLKDDLYISGKGFDLTGTIVLTAERGTNDMEITGPELNNLAIDISGDARPDFSRSASEIRIRNNFSVKSRSTRPVRFRDKHFHIGGDLSMDIEGPGQAEPGSSFLFFDGSGVQRVRNYGYDGPGMTGNMVINNSYGVVMADGNLTVDGLIHFERGVLTTTHGNLLKSGPAGSVSWMQGSYINGPFGRYHNLAGKTRLDFPVGNEDGPNPVFIEFMNNSDNLRLYVTEFISTEPPVFPLDQGINEILPGRGHFKVEGSDQDDFSDGSISLVHRANDPPAEMLGIARLQDDMWINLGGVSETTGLISSALRFSGTGIFALCRLEGPDPNDDTRSFTVYPNPVIPEGTVYFFRRMDITLFNLSGVALLDKKDAASVNLQGIPVGVYILRNGDGKYARIIVVHDSK